MSKIGIFGGTFDPIHIGHLIIAEFFTEQLNLDNCIFVPAYQNPLKEGLVPTDSKHRLNMLNLAISNNDKFISDDFEINRNKPSYTINTIEHLYEKHPGCELYLLIGNDNIYEFKKWQRWKEILQLTHLCCAGRTSQIESDMDSSVYLGSEIIKINSPILDVSGEDIREKLKSGKSVKYLITDEVLEYIVSNQLYFSKS